MENLREKKKKKKRIGVAEQHDTSNTGSPLSSPPP
jgi:hypothetical protein